jgi:hypothetical protein
MLNGFRDNATVRRHFSWTILYTPRVWFSDDDTGSFGFDAERLAFIAIDVRLPFRGIQSVSNAKDRTWPYTEYWGPASIWNEFSRTRLQLDDIIKLRLSKQSPQRTP